MNLPREEKKGGGKRGKRQKRRDERGALVKGGNDKNYCGREKKRN